MATKLCTKCGNTGEFYKRPGRNKTNSWCTTCVVKLINARHELKKMTLVLELGGKCVDCGWDKNPRVLHFHHVNPATKKFGIAAKLGRSMDALRQEASKCVLLCGNCHIERHLATIDQTFIPLIKKI